MYFPVHFKRQKGAASSDPVLGAASDPAPAFADGENKTASWVGNKLAIKLQGVGNPPRRIAVGYRFDDGAGGAGGDLASVSLWVFDRTFKKWFQCSTGTLKDGQLTYFRAPYLMDPPPTTANLNQMSGGADYMLIVPDPGGGAANGVYHFLMGPDLAEF